MGRVKLLQSLKTIWSRFLRPGIGRLLETTGVLPWGMTEAELSDLVWYVESTLPSGEKQMGSGVVLRLRREGETRNVLLTCRHVVRCMTTGAGPVALRCWPNGNGYNPDTQTESRVWRASTWNDASPAFGPDQPTRHLQDATLDWELLLVERGGHAFDACSSVCGVSAPRPRLSQEAAPYRLIGYPDGNRTMERDVVRASVSRDFRLSNLDARPGLMSLVGPENTGAGYSGGPYLSGDGRLVALHRGLGAANARVGLSAKSLEDALRAAGWEVIAGPASRGSWSARALRALLFVGLCVLLTMGWSSLTPPPVELYAIEGVVTESRVDSRYLRGHPLAPVPRLVDAPDHASVRGRLLRYTAPAFDSFNDFDRVGDYVVTEKIRYRWRWLGLPGPTGEVTVRVRRHLPFDSLDSFYDALSDLSAAERAAWHDPERRPSLTISDSGERVLLDRNLTRLRLVRPPADPPLVSPRLEFSLRDESPMRSCVIESSVCGAADPLIDARYVYILGDDEHAPKYNANRWVLNFAWEGVERRGESLVLPGDE